MAAAGASASRLPPKLVRRLSMKARRNCINIGVAQNVAASWANNSGSGIPVVPAATAVNTAIPVEAGDDVVVRGNGGLQVESLPDLKEPSFLSSRTIHAGWRLGRGIVVDAITTPVVNASAYIKVNCRGIVTVAITTPVVNASAYFKEKRATSFEYGRYGNPTTVVAEEKISALEGAESTVITASGMCAITNLLKALVPPGGHIVTTTDCYRKTRITSYGKTRSFIETILTMMAITATVIDPADIGALEDALNKNKVSLFFTESLTNPFLRCVDIERVSKLCHSKGALVCIDATATPLNQKALALGADLIVHSATKYIGGHNDVLAGFISGPSKLVSEIRNLRHIIGGALNPNATNLITRDMKTLHLHVQQQNSTGLGMAEILEAHPKVADVYYPGLPNHPEHELAKKQMTGFGGVVSFEIDGDLDTTIKFVDALKIPDTGASFGGCKSIVDQPATMSYRDLSQAERLKYGIKDNLVRFSFGVEDFDDLKADILQALDNI